MKTKQRMVVKGKAKVAEPTIRKPLRTEAEVAKFLKANAEELNRKGVSGQVGQLVRYVSMSEFPIGKNIVVKNIKGLQPPKPKKQIEWFTKAGCRGVRLMFLHFGKRKVKVLPGLNKENVREGGGSGRRFYDIKVEAVK